MTHALLLPRAFKTRDLQTPAHPSIPLALGENTKLSRQKWNFHHNPTPSSHVKIIDDYSKPIAQIPIRGSIVTTSASNRTNAPACRHKHPHRCIQQKINTATTTTTTAVTAATSAPWMQLPLGIPQRSSTTSSLQRWKIYRKQPPFISKTLLSNHASMRSQWTWQSCRVAC